MSNFSEFKTKYLIFSNTNNGSHQKNSTETFQKFSLLFFINKIISSNVSTEIYSFLKLTTQ